MFQNTAMKTPGRLLVSYRILLAAFGGFLFTLILSVFLPEAFLWLWGWNKATSLMWMMLLSFGIYCALIMWIIATRKLLRTSIILLLLGVSMSVGFAQLQPDSEERTTQSEVIE